MNEIISSYLNGRKNLNELLNIGSDYDVTFNLEDKWNSECGDIQYFVNGVEYGYDSYGNKPEGHTSTDETFITFLVNDGNGSDPFYAVFKVANNFEGDYE